MYAVLADVDIEEAIQEGDILIFPYDKDLVNNSSVDVTLGEWYYAPTGAEMPFFDHESQECIDKYWGEPKEAVDGYIIIPPNTTFLCHTNEFIGGVDGSGITTMMKAKSTLGRCCLSVCQCAGWGDVGYVNRWTMEVRNQSNIPQRIRVGARMAQIVFLRTNPNCNDYVGKGHYQTSSNIKEVRESWCPEMMKPRGR